MAQESASIRSLLDPVTLAAIDSLELRARMIVEGLTSGMHRSPYAGYSVEFAQHRAYAPGDDLRHLDWKVFGRSDRLVVKQYQQETNLDLHVLVDVSGSMAYGSMPGGDAGRVRWRKVDAAATLGAAIALLAIRQGDRAGLLLFDPRHPDQPLRQTTRLASGEDHWRALLGAFAAAEPATAESIAAAHDGARGVPADPADVGRVIDQFVARTARRSLVVLLSDLLDDAAGLEQAVARLSHRGHDLLLIQTLDHAERTFPFTQGAWFYGLEGEGRLSIDPASLRRAYLQSLERQIAAVSGLARRFGFDHALFDTAQPLGPLLAQFLARRTARLARTGAH